MNRLLMTYLKLTLLSLMGMLILICSALAEDKATAKSEEKSSDKIVTDTDWLLPQKGAEGKKLGAKVESVTETEEEGVYRIEVSIPKVDKEIEEVVAIGRREDVEKPELQKRRFEIINDPETGRSGVVIYLGKPEIFALKFNYYEGERQY